MYVLTDVIYVPGKEIQDEEYFFSEFVPDDDEFKKYLVILYSPTRVNATKNDDSDLIAPLVEAGG